jgi:hypothetical protein
MNNAYIYEGVLQKRLGYSDFGAIVHVASGTLDTGDGSTATFSGTITNVPIRGDDFTVTTTVTSGSVTETVTPIDATTSGTTLSGVYGTGGTLNRITGVWTLDYSTCLSGVPENSADIDVVYDYLPGNSVMGLWSYYTNAGTNELLAMDTKRMNRWDADTEKFEDITLTDIWDSTEDEYLFATNWNDIMYMTNNTDRVNITNLDMVLVATNELLSCLLIFPYKNRLVLLRTNESTDGACQQRARWCKPNDPNDWTNDGYVDADTVEWIMAAEFLGDELIVFFERSVWTLEYTEDEDLPFVWRKIADTEGAYATFTASAFSDEVTVLGPTGLIGTDGRDVYRIGEKIPDITLDWNPSNLNWSYSATLDELRQVWTSYVDIASEVVDSVLVMNYKEKSWSIYDLSMVVFGFYEAISSAELTWDEIEETWDEIEWAWDDRTRVAGYPITLGGDTSGNIYRLNHGGTDDGADISFEVQSARLNPYAEQGLKARLGWVDFLVEPDLNIDVNIDFYMNYDASPYLTKSMNFASVNDTAEKIWIRVPVNSVAASHQFRLYHTASNETVKIYGILAFFRPSGQIHKGAQ